MGRGQAPTRRAGRDWSGVFLPASGSFPAGDPAFNRRRDDAGCGNVADELIRREAAGGPVDPCFAVPERAVPVAAPGQEIVGGDRIRPAVPQRGAVDREVADAVAGRCLHGQGEGESGHLRKPARGAWSPAHAVLQRRPYPGAGKPKHDGPVPEGEFGQQVLPGKERAGRVHRVAANGAAVDDGHVAPGGRPHGVGQQIAEGGFAGARPDAARIELGGRGSDRRVQGPVEPGLVGGQLRCKFRMFLEAGGGAQANVRGPGHRACPVAAPDLADPEGQHGDMVPLGSGLQHRLASVVAGDEQMIVAAEHDIDLRDGSQELEVRLEPLVRECDDQVGAGGPERRRQPRTRFRHRREDDVRAGAGDDRRLGGHEADEADVVALCFEHRGGGGARQEPPVDAHVARQPDRLGLGQAPFEHVGAEIEFVVARHRDIEPDGVGEVHHMRAPVDPRQDGRRDQIAAEGDHRLSAGGRGPGAFLGDDGGDPGRSPRFPHAGHLIPVVHVDQDQRRRLGPGRGGRCGGGAHGQEGGDPRGPPMPEVTDHARAHRSAGSEQGTSAHPADGIDGAAGPRTAGAAAAGIRADRTPCRRAPAGMMSTYRNGPQVGDRRPAGIRSRPPALLRRSVRRRRRASLEVPAADAGRRPVPCRPVGCRIVTIETIREWPAECGCDTLGRAASRTGMRGPFRPLPGLCPPSSVPPELGPHMHAVEHTVARPVSFRDRGLFTGETVAMTIHPAPAGSGIVLVRSDLPGLPEIPAQWGRVADSRRRTMMLGVEGGGSIWTVEHLLAAFAGLGIDNARVELGGREVPILDGSAAVLAAALEDAGVVAQDRLRSWIRVRRPVRVANGTGTAVAEPAESFTVHGTIDYPDTLIGRQSYAFTLEGTRFRDEIAAARTFCTRAEAENLRRQNLGLGGHPGNVIQVDGMRLQARGGLRHPDEFVRHKVLDCVGDLYLAGAQLLGRVTFVRGGHDINRRLLEAIFSEPANWERSTRPPASGAWARAAARPAAA